MCHIQVLLHVRPQKNRNQVFNLAALHPKKMLDFFAMYASTMHAVLPTLSGNYTVSCIFIPYMALRFLTAEYMQLVGNELNSAEVILSLFFFNSFPMKVSGNPAHSREGNSLASSPERQLRYLYHTILYLYCTYTHTTPYYYTISRKGGLVVLDLD